MEVKLFCDLHDEQIDYEAFQWLDEDDQTAIDCPICVAEEILADYSIMKYPANRQSLRD